MTKKLAASILCLALAFSLAGCGIFRGAAPENTPAVPDDFSLRFSWWYDETQKNILDTQTGSIQKDLASDGTASAAQPVLRRSFARSRTFCSGCTSLSANIALRISTAK